MKKPDIDKIPPGPELDALVAEAVMGWQKVHCHGAGKDGKSNHYSGRKQDKLGRWRLAEVPAYSTDPRESSTVEARMKELGLLKKYLNELNKIAHAKELPAEWARAASRSWWKNRKGVFSRYPKTITGSWRESDRGGIRLWGRVHNMSVQWKVFLDVIS